MKRVPYSEIAESIAAARSENEYARAGSLVDAYYAVCPAPDSVAERIALLGKVLDGLSTALRYGAKATPAVELTPLRESRASRENAASCAAAYRRLPKKGIGKR